MEPPSFYRCDLRLNGEQEAPRGVWLLGSEVGERCRLVSEWIIFEADNYMLLLNWISSGPIISVPPRGPITRVPLRTMTGHTREQGIGGHTSLSGASKYIPDYCAAIAPQVSLVDTFSVRCSKFFYGRIKTFCLGENKLCQLVFLNESQ